MKTVFRFYVLWKDHFWTLEEIVRDNEDISLDAIEESRLLLRDRLAIENDKLLRVGPMDACYSVE